MWYLFPQMELHGNFPVWSMYMVFFVSYDLIKMLCLISCCLFVLFVLVVLDSSPVLVERMRCISTLMCPFFVSSDSGKNCWHYWCWQLARLHSFRVGWLCAPWNFLRNLLLHEGIWWFFQYLGFHICCLWILVCVWSWVFVHGELQFRLLGQSRGNLLIVFLPYCLVARCRNWGLRCWYSMGCAIVLLLCTAYLLVLPTLIFSFWRFVHHICSPHCHFRSIFSHHQMFFWHWVVCAVLGQGPCG